MDCRMQEAGGEATAGLLAICGPVGGAASKAAAGAPC